MRFAEFSLRLLLFVVRILRLQVGKRGSDFTLERLLLGSGPWRIVSIVLQQMSPLMIPIARRAQKRIRHFDCPSLFVICSRAPCATRPKLYGNRQSITSLIKVQRQGLSCAALTKTQMECQPVLQSSGNVQSNNARKSHNVRACQALLTAKLETRESPLQPYQNSSMNCQHTLETMAKLTILYSTATTPTYSARQAVL